MLNEKQRNREKVIDILFAEGIIDQNTSMRVTDELNRNPSLSIPEILTKQKVTTDEQVAQAIAKASNVSYINLAAEKISRDALAYVKAEEAIKNLIIPFYVDDKIIKIAIADLDIIERQDPQIWARIRKISGRRIDLYIAKISDIQFALKHYGLKQETKIIRPMEQTSIASQKKEKGILAVLITQDLISPQQGEKIKQEAESKKIRVDDLLAEKKVITEEELAKSYASLYDHPYIRLASLDIPYEIIAKFPEEISRKYRLVAFEMLGNRVVKVAISRPFDPQVEELLEFVAEKNEIEIDKYITTDSDIETALNLYQTKAPKPVAKPRVETKPEEKEKEVKPTYVSPAPAQPVAPAPAGWVGGPEPQKEEEKVEEEPVAQADIGRLLKENIKNVSQLEEIIKQGSVPHIVAAVINFAVFRRASDAHIQPTEKTLRVRYRIDGILNDITTVPLEMHPAIVSRIKILSKLRIDEKRIPQDGRFEVVFGDRQVDIRVSTLPTIHGEKVVMRLLDTSGGVYSLDELGLRGRAFKVFIKNITKPFGMIIATGPTGSGKSTTLYAALNYINKPGVNIVTLEDPVEYDIEGINQSQAKPDIGYDFAEGLRSILRQDPDVIMVGEIRDKETAGMAIHASLTGHLVFSSLHTNESAGAVPRLIDMGIEPFLIISAVNIFLAQRLVRTICPNCKQEDHLPPTLYKKMEKSIDKLPAQIKAKFKKPYKFYKGAGCRNCNEGYRGRIGLFEVLPMTEKIQKMTMASPTAVMIKKTAISEGMLTLKQDGLVKALEGITTVEEVLRVTIS